MFENVINFFKKIGKKDQIEAKSKDTAKERLHLVLMQDRANVSADFLDMMRQEIIEVIKKYIDVDEKDIDVRLTNKTNEDGTTGAPALYANIPIAGIREEMKKERTFRKRDLTVCIVLRILVIITIVTQALRGDFENVFLGILTLILFTIPSIIDRKLNIKLPNALETVILLFIFSAEVLGEIQNFYGIFKFWDTMLHTINGFLCAAIGFSLIDILNRSPKFHLKMSPIFVALVAFCFSMTIGVIWEFFEYGSDNFTRTDMQKDRITSSISSVLINETGKNIPIKIDNIQESIIKYEENGEMKEFVINGGNLDIGLKDTMKDLMVNFIGAIVFSIIGMLYIKNRDEYKFAENFIPTMKTDEAE